MRIAVLLLSVACLQVVGINQVHAQVPNEDLRSAGQTRLLSEQELQSLVGPIALYPDDLLSLVLPASTYPIQIVQASRFLKKTEKRTPLKPEQRWDPSVVGLLNYPEVLAMMNSDLDWTWKLGAAVVNQHEDVLAAIQIFRQRANAAGNLKSDSKLKIVENGEVIVIEPTDPETICVPEYDPEIVVVRRSYPVIYEYSDPYPVYYYPSAYYPVFWSGFVVIYGFDWFHNHIHRRYYRGNIRVKSHRSFRTQRLKFHHKSVGRPGKRFFRQASLREDFRHRPGDNFRADRFRRDFDGDRRKSKFRSIHDKRRFKKFMRAKEGEIHQRDRRRQFGKANRHKDSRSHRHRGRVKNHRSYNKNRSISKSKRHRKSFRSYSSNRKIRTIRKHRSRTARYKNRRFSNRNRTVRNKSANRRVRFNRNRVSRNRARVSSRGFGARTSRIRVSRRGNGGHRSGGRGFQRRGR